MKELEVKKNENDTKHIEPRSKKTISKKRQWQEPEEQLLKKTKQDNEDCFTRIKRKKSAVILGYCGANYFGMQRNPGMKTIEEELLKAMKENNWISEEAFNQPQSIAFQRAARTDKGVSACMQCVSLKLPDNLDIECLNKNLPEEIRIFCVQRVTKGFNSKDQCDFRTYSYTLPTIAFANHNDDKVEMNSYRLSSERLNNINDTLKLYEGTKNYHNFTSKKAFFDPSARRYIVSVECGSPFLVEEKYEFATIKIKGQSFMLHQIRKMVGLTLAVIRGLTSSDIITKAFKEEKIDLPTAPGLGLVLNQVHYDRYNNRYGNDGIHKHLVYDDYKTQIDDFAEKYIILTIVNTEIREKIIMEWVKNLNRHSYEVRQTEIEGNQKAASEDE